MSLLWITYTFNFNLLVWYEKVRLNKPWFQKGMFSICSSEKRLFNKANKCKLNIIVSFTTELKQLPFIKEILYKLFSKPPLNVSILSHLYSSKTCQYQSCGINDEGYWKIRTIFHCLDKAGMGNESWVTSYGLSNTCSSQKWKMRMPAIPLPQIFLLSWPVAFFIFSLCCFLCIIHYLMSVL